MVGEPTVEDTIAILRGLKPRYEAHHGVKIKDRRSSPRRSLSHRYITDRFLPDKAIDLMDEAASRLAMELRKRADRNRRGPAPASRNWNWPPGNWPRKPKSTPSIGCEDIQTEMDDLRRKLASLREQWEAEKAGVGDTQELREELAQAGTRIREPEQRDQGKAVRRCSRSARTTIKSCTNSTRSASSSPSGSKPKSPTNRLRKERARNRLAGCCAGSRTGRNRRGRQRVDRHPVSRA